MFSATFSLTARLISHQTHGGLKAVKKKDAKFKKIQLLFSLNLLLLVILLPMLMEILLVTLLM
jgi:hypothetical protein